MKDDLGKRMKENYEYRTRTFLPRRTFTIIRLDGKAFHNFTKGFERPYDTDLMTMMDNTAKKLCEEIQGCKMAYVQSDEISLLLTDFDKMKTDAWFDGNVQKMVSISASIATVAFNKAIKEHCFPVLDLSFTKFYDKKGDWKTAMFDSRVFTIPELEEVVNYLIWRQKDATRNSITMAAQSMYSHKELHGKNGDEKQEMIFQKGKNWDTYPIGFKRGRVIKKITYQSLIAEEHKKLMDFFDAKDGMVTRTRWDIVDPPVFTQDRDFIYNLVKSEAE